MAEEIKSAKEAQSEMKGQFPDRNKIMCKDCIFRDATVVKIGNEQIPFGVTKAFCDIYPGPPKDNGKPHEVLFENGKCEFYAKEV